MTKSAFFKTGALGALATALLAFGLPAQAQDRGRGGRGHHAEAGGQIRQDRAQSPRQSRPTASARSEWRDQPRESARSQAYARQAAEPQAQAQAQVATPARNTTYTAQRDRSYGAYARHTGQSDQQARESQAQIQRSAAASQAYARTHGSSNGWSGQHSDDRRGDNARRGDWQRDRPTQARTNDRGNYREGYRDGRRADNRYDNDHRRWDTRRWRNDNRYDWYRYRASNRALFNLGRYYSPYRGYNYSRLSIGFRLGSLFYSSRYWINDPWQYRLPEVYGPYRWIRYYNDALLVDIYTGEVVDEINNFFW